MTNIQTTYPGLNQPQISSYTPGAGNPRDSAIMANQAMNVKQASLNSIGGKRRKKYRGGNVVAVPQFQMQYTATNGASNPNAQIKGLSSIGMQTTANSAYDNQATKGGSKRTRRKKGGNSNWSWGCYSGGKSKKNKKKNNSNKKKKQKKRSYKCRSKKNCSNK